MSECVGQEYENGPRATGSNSCPNFSSYDPSAWPNLDADGHWHFPGPDVPDKDEVKEAIRIEPLKQGFLVKCRCVAERALTDRVDAAEWLLGWLGFEDETVESVRDILWDADELYNILSDCVAGVDYDELEDIDELYVDPDYTVHRAFFDFAPTARAGYDELEHIDCQGALDVARAAQAFIEEVEAGGFGEDGQYQKLVKAVKKWWEGDMVYRTDGGPCTWEQPEGIDTCTEEIEKLAAEDYQNRLDVLGVAQAYTESNFSRAKSLALAEAVRKWRGIGHE